MAHGVMKRPCKGDTGKGIGSRRIFAPLFKLQVLDSYRNDADCKGNQRATARKYGIHRRQIQKWLQVENTLRSSVRKGEKAPGAGRQRGASAEAPLDFTTHSRGQAAPPAEPATPMDLSLKRPSSSAPGAPAPAPLSPLRSSSPPSLARPHPDVWDLSTKAPKPVKLFKPYLDDEPKPKTKPCCSLPVAKDYAYNNNNGEPSDYTLYELQPKASYYYYPEYDYNFFDDGYALKQRQTYSLDFKLSAIDCYYQDSICKGSQRAVATKYNIHRRQVQKWLQQADELRQRSETKTHAVR